MSGARYASWGASIIFVIALILWGYATMRDTVPSALTMGEPAPGFELRDLDGELVRLSDFRGQPVVLRFSSRTCSFCYDDFGFLERFQDNYDGDLQVIAIEVNTPAAMVRDAVRDRNESYPVLLDPQGEVGAAFRLTGLPQAYFINEDGRLFSRIWGELQEMDVRPNIAQILRSDGQAFTNIEDEVRAVATQVRCQECQGLSVWQSQVASAWDMRDEIRELFAAGKTRSEVLDALVDHYGVWILLSPPAEGGFVWAYIVPFAVIGVGGLTAHWLLSRRRKGDTSIDTDGEGEVDPEAEARVRKRLQEYL